MGSGFVFESSPSVSTTREENAKHVLGGKPCAPRPVIRQMRCVISSIRTAKSARSALDALQIQTGFVTGAVAAGSLVPTRPVSTCPARRRWNAGLDDIVTCRSYQLLLHDRSQ